jgi:segregation and condensation protein A
MALALAQDAIALLIDLAERGEIDPWDVKVVDVIDRFLSELDPFENSSEPYEANLSQSGQAFLYASMLLFLKADSLTQAEIPDEEEALFEDGELLTPEFGTSALPPFLERQLRRRAVARPPQRRRVTLKELIDQLRTIATALEEKTPRTRMHRPRQSRKQAIRAIAQLAHQENLSELAAALEQFLTEQWSTIARGQHWLDFDLVLELWSEVKAFRTDEIHAIDGSEADAQTRHDRVGVFWALLLLSAQSKVELAQEEFYQDLKIHLLSEEVMAELAEISARASPD